MSQDWWLNATGTALEQGDIITGLPVGTVNNPIQFVQKAQKANSDWYQPHVGLKADAAGFGHYLIRGAITSVAVISAGCEIEKDKKDHRIVVAGVRSMDSLNPQEQDKVKNQRKYHSLPLPAVPDIGDSYIDLRISLYFPMSVLLAAKRVASMTDAGIFRLQAQLVAFYARLDPSAIEECLKASAAAEAAKKA